MKHWNAFRVVLEQESRLLLDVILEKSSGLIKAVIQDSRSAINIPRDDFFPRNVRDEIFIQERLIEI